MEPSVYNWTALSTQHPQVPRHEMFNGVSTAPCKTKSTY